MADIIKAAPAKVPGLHPAEPKLLKKDSVAALTEATAILASAQEQARRIIATAENQREHTLAEARREGEAEGLRRYLAAIAETGEKLDRFYAEAEPELIRLAAGIARKILSAELTTRPDALAGIARQALAGLRQARRVTLEVHPDDVETLRAQAPSLDLSATAEVQVIGKATLTRGSCVIETELGMIDARLETQLELIERALTRRPQ